MYEKLELSVKDLQQFYDIDKIKIDSVYVWTKGDDGENVFDIEADEVYFYNTAHNIPEDAKPIIENIQKVLRELRALMQVGGTTC